MQKDARELDAASLKREQEFPAERASGRRRLSGTRLGGEDRLVMTRRHGRWNIRIANRLTDPRDMFQAIAWRIDAPEDRKVGPLAAHDRLDAVHEQPLARAQGNVGMRRIRLNRENVPLVGLPDADPQLHQ